MATRKYDHLAAIYDRRWSSYIKATVQATLDRLVLRPGDRILDLGCGTGALLQALADQDLGLDLAGLDYSHEMLAIARSKLPVTVTLCQGNAAELPWDDRHFDWVISTSAFHYFPAPDRVLQDIRRVLKPTGQAVITDWCHDYLTCRLCDWILRRQNTADYVQVYGQNQCQDLFVRNGFQAIALERYKINWLWGLMTAQAIPGGLIQDDTFSQREVG